MVPRGERGIEGRAVGEDGEEDFGGEGVERGWHCGLVLLRWGGEVEVRFWRWMVIGWWGWYGLGLAQYFTLDNDDCIT